MSANETVLHLPNGDFEVLREEQLNDPRQRQRLLELMLTGENFNRTFWWWAERIRAFGLSRATRHTADRMRGYLPQLL